jgi:hypothetical protein
MIIVYQVYFQIIELEKLTNSRPGMRFSISKKKLLFHRQGFFDYWRVVFIILLYHEDLFMTSSNKCISHPKIPKGKGHGQSLTELIRLEVTLEDNVSGVKNEFRPRI